MPSAHGNSNKSNMGRGGGPGTAINSVTDADEPGFLVFEQTSDNGKGKVGFQSKKGQLPPQAVMPQKIQLMDI